MPTKTLSQLLGAVLAIAALLALPAAANAELAFVKGTVSPTIYRANDNGSGIHRVGSGRAPKVSPDGKSIAFESEAAGHKPVLNIAPVAGGKVKTVMTGLRESYEMVWSPDSQMFAAIKGNELGKRKLVLLDLATGAERTIASGYFYGITFSADSSQLAYGMATSENFPLRSDVYKVATAGGKPKAITRDHNSAYPLWSAQGQIAFVKELGAKTRQYQPKNEIYLMDENGRGVRRLTHTNVSQLSQGLLPTAWSADGTELLTQFGGQDITYAVTVNPKTGAQKPLVEETEQGFIGTGLSANGKLVLGAEGGFEPGNNRFVGTVPYGGGKARVLVRNAYEPSWDQ